MKVKTLQIIWHGKDPVLSLDFHHSGLLATAGADFDIKLWELNHDEKGAPFAKYAASLNHHTTPVNVIRFSPTGDQLASGADGGELLIWKLVRTEDGLPLSWKVSGSLRRHSRDVLDLEWSPDGSGLISGSVDNSSIVWDVSKGDPVHHFRDHLHYVQGVTWDPAGQYVVTQSGDRTCRVYGRPSQAQKNPKRKDKGVPAAGGLLFTCQHVLLKRNVTMLRGSVVPSPAVNPAPASANVASDSHSHKEAEGANNKAVSTKHHLFYDENLPSFFRRLCFSPDGSFLVVPAGQYKHTLESSLVNTSYVFSRKDLSRPAFHLPGHPKAVVVIRFCPMLFELTPESGSTAVKADNNGKGESVKTFALPYRLVFAVATLDSLFLYDTQSTQPIAVIAGLHYAPITDCAWATDGSMIAISSQDGYCTMVTFLKGELGNPISARDIPAHIAEYLPQTVRDRAAAATTAAPSSAPAVQAGESEGINRGKKRRRPPSCSPAKPMEPSQSSAVQQSPVHQTTDMTMLVEPANNAEPNSALEKKASKKREEIEEAGLFDDAPKPKRHIFPVAVEKNVDAAEQINKTESGQTETDKSEKKGDSVAVELPKAKRRIVPTLATSVLTAAERTEKRTARPQSCDGMRSKMELKSEPCLNTSVGNRDITMNVHDAKSVMTACEPPKAKRRIVPIPVSVGKHVEGEEKGRQPAQVLDSGKKQMAVQQARTEPCGNIDGSCNNERKESRGSEIGGPNEETQSAKPQVESSPVGQHPEGGNSVEQGREHPTGETSKESEEAACRMNDVGNNEEKEGANCRADSSAMQRSSVPAMEGVSNTVVSDGHEVIGKVVSMDTCVAKETLPSAVKPTAEKGAVPSQMGRDENPSSLEGGDPLPVTLPV